ncbi:MAG: hypothetical protein HY040_24610 [Planctomycetes bacterium]|nr:hypothetical protein [Planctomycetota bacterium]
MRRSLVVLLGLIAVPSMAAAQSFPAEMTITATEIEVRCGPTKEYYATSKLRYGERVLVLRESKDQPGWLAIRPPHGSFSWINAHFVKQAAGDAHTGYVETEGSVAVPVRPGSSLTNRAPDVESVKVQPGTLVTILDRPVTSDGVIWLPIAPPPTEVRFIPADAVRPQQFANNNQNFNGPQAANVAGNPLIVQADQAFQAGNIDKAKQLYKEAAEHTEDINQKIYCYNRLSSLQNPWNPSQSPGNPNQVAQGATPVQTIGQTTSFSRTPAPQVINYPPQWSNYGVLRRAAFEKDGQPMYVLESGKGQVLMYVTSPAGTSLRDYVGRTVALYGSITYRSDDAIRTHFITATHVALP